MFIFKPYNHDELDQMVISQDINKLKEHAKEVRNWTQWRSELEEFIEENSDGEVASILK